MLWEELFFRFRDQMTVTRPKPPAHPKDRPWFAIQEQGYPESWYGHIVASTGDRYAVPTTEDRSQEVEQTKARVLGL